MSTCRGQSPIPTWPFLWQFPTPGRFCASYLLNLAVQVVDEVIIVIRRPLEDAFWPLASTQNALLGCGLGGVMIFLYDLPMFCTFNYVSFTVSMRIRLQPCLGLMKLPH